MIREHGPHIDLAQQRFDVGPEPVQDRDDILSFRCRKDLFGKPLERLAVLVKKEGYTFVKKPAQLEARFI